MECEEFYFLNHLNLKMLAEEKYFQLKVKGNHSEVFRIF